MILEDLYTEIASKTALTATNTVHKAIMLRSANGQLKRIFTNLNLVSERTSAELTTTSGTHTYLLDSRVLRALNFRETDSPSKLTHMTRQQFEKEYPYPASTESGVPTLYIPMRKVRVSAQPTAASTISVVSSSAADITSYYVIVRGISGGVMKTERLTLTGAAAVTSTNSYTSLLSISKDTTTGTVTATSDAGATTNISLLPGEKEKEHWEIRLHEIPDDTYTIPYSFQYIPWTLSYDEETICIPDIFIEAYKKAVEADVLAQLGDPRRFEEFNRGEKMLGEVHDNNFLGEDADARFGFEEISYEEMA